MCVGSAYLGCKVERKPVEKLFFGLCRDRDIDEAMLHMNGCIEWPHGSNDRERSAGHSKGSVREIRLRQNFVRRRIAGVQPSSYNRWPKSEGMLEELERAGDCLGLLLRRQYAHVRTFCAVCTLMRGDEQTYFGTALQQFVDEWGVCTRCLTRDKNRRDTRITQNHRCISV